MFLRFLGERVTKTTVTKTSVRFSFYCTVTLIIVGCSFTHCNKNNRTSAIFEAQNNPRADGRDLRVGAACVTAATTCRENLTDHQLWRRSVQHTHENILKILHIYISPTNSDFKLNMNLCQVHIICLFKIHNIHTHTKCEDYHRQNIMLLFLD